MPLLASDNSQRIERCRELRVQILNLQNTLSLLWVIGSLGILNDTIFSATQNIRSLNEFSIQARELFRTALRDRGLQTPDDALHECLAQLTPDEADKYLRVHLLILCLFRRRVDLNGFGSCSTLCVLEVVPCRPLMSLWNCCCGPFSRVSPGSTSWFQLTCSDSRQEELLIIRSASSNSDHARWSSWVSSTFQSTHRSPRTDIMKGCVRFTVHVSATATLSTLPPTHVGSGAFDLNDILQQAWCLRHVPQVVWGLDHASCHFRYVFLEP